MTSTEMHNPPQAGQDQCGQNSGGAETDANRIKQLQRRVSYAVSGAAAYTALGTLECFTIPTIPGDIDMMMIDALSVFIVAGIPALIFGLRRGYVTPIILALVATANALGGLAGWLGDDVQYGPFSVLFNLFFVAVFLAGAHSSFRLTRTAS